MIDWLDALVGLGIGVLLGAAATGAVLLPQRNRDQPQLNNARTRAELLTQRLQQVDQEAARLRSNLEDANTRRESAERSVAALTEKVKAFGEAESRLNQAFRAAGAEALEANSKHFTELASRTLQTILAEAKGDVEKRQEAIESLVHPIKELLEKHNHALTDLERKREVAYTGLEEQIKAIATSHERLGMETRKLVTALRRPEQRGRWGEMQLRNTVELAGMTEHCDFIEQPRVQTETEVLRPDMKVNFPGGGEIVVDAKVALDAYLEALQPEADFASLMQTHAQQLRKHIGKLADKQYWDQFERSPKLVVMFIPLESALTAALEVRPTLLEEAMKLHIVIATPTLLVALLRAVAYGWRQEDVAANARQIAKVGDELYCRLAIFVRHFERVGSQLDGARQAYNKAVGSLESRVLVSTRELKHLHAATDPPIKKPPTLEVETRRVTASELKGEAVTESEGERPTSNVER